MKKFFIITGILVIGVVLFLIWFKNDTKKHSPFAKANFSKGDLQIQVDYCRPYAKGRVIFGDAAAGALQPYGSYWRAGANEATVFETNKSIMFNDKELPAGKYAMYAYPGIDKWTVCINKEWDRWGAQEPDAKEDILRTEVAPVNSAEFTEQFEISFQQPDSSETFQMVWKWEKVELSVPLKLK